MQQSALILPGHDGSGRQGTAALIPHGLILPRMGWAGSFSGYCCFFGEMPGSRARPSRGHHPWVTGRKEKLVTPFPLGDSFLSSGWDPNLHSHGGLRGLPWLGMLPVVPSPETLLGITSLLGWASLEGTGGYWSGWFAHWLPAPGARPSPRCPGKEQPGHTLPLAAGKEDLHNKPLGCGAESS